MRLLIFLLFVTLLEQSYCEDGRWRGCWKGNIIPYKIYPGFAVRHIEVIREQIAILHDVTCLRWVDEEAAMSLWQLDSSVWFVFGPQCILKKHKVNESRMAYEVQLNEECFKGKWIMNKIMYALGFHNEHQRADRDCYVKVSWLMDFIAEWKIVKHDYEGNWLERFPYDKYSVMHYHRTSRVMAKSEGLMDKYEPLGNHAGELTQLDKWKLLFKFCNYPHFCDIEPETCEVMEITERAKNCSLVNR